MNAHGACRRAARRARAARCLTSLLVVLLASAPAAAVGSKGESWFRHHLSEDERAGGAPAYVTFVVRWDVGVIAGEPLVVCRGAWLFRPQDARVTGGGQLPPEVLAELRLVIAEVQLPVFREAGAGLSMRCDLGVMEPPFLGTKEQFLRLSAEERKKHYSYNVPGSPKWEELFYDVNGRYLDEERAIELMKRGFDAGSRPHHPAVLWRHELDLLPVRMFLEQKKLADLRAEREQERERRRQESERRYGARPGAPAVEEARPEEQEREPLRDAKSFWSVTKEKPADAVDEAAIAKSFWQRPADERTLEDAKKDEALEQRELALTKTLDALEPEVRKVRERIAARRREIANRPPPGGPKLPAFATERRLRVPGWKYSLQVLGGASSLQNTTVETEMFAATPAAWAGDTHPYFLDLRTGRLLPLSRRFGMHGQDIALASPDRKTFAWGSFVIVPDEGRFEGRQSQRICAFSPDGAHYLDCQSGWPLVRELQSGAAVAEAPPSLTELWQRCHASRYNAANEGYARVELFSGRMFKIGPCVFDAVAQRVVWDDPQGYRCGIAHHERGATAVCLEQLHHGSRRTVRLLELDEGYQIRSTRDVAEAIDGQEGNGFVRARWSRSGKKLLLTVYRWGGLVVDAQTGVVTRVRGGASANEARLLDAVALAKEGAADVEIFDASTGNKLREVAAPSCERPRFLAISPDGQHLTWLCADGELVVKEDRPPP